MEVVVEIIRTYTMDEDKILSEPSFNPPGPNASMEEKQEYITESFYELCGDWRDEDHIDGSYVKLISDSGETHFEWPNEKLRRLFKGD